MRYKTVLLNCCLAVQILVTLHGCSSTVRAPVDSRTDASSADTQASYSNSNDNENITEGKLDHHVVVKGDTLYSIAWRYGFDYRDVARWNDITGKYVIYPGQHLRLQPASVKAKPLQAGPIISKQDKNTTRAKSTSAGKPPPKSTTATNVKKQTVQTSTRISWQWPTKGKLVQLNTPTSKKGVDIAGRVGQIIAAAADGDVVYSGSGLLHYGKLIIIKHSDTFLSAYAHNQTLYAKEGDKVKAGQKIATMGQGNKGRPILHFEIRKNGTPENPLIHLPKNS